MKASNGRINASSYWRIGNSYWGVLFEAFISGLRGKKLYSAIVICVLTVLSSSAIAQEQRGISISSERLALVIGNSDYQTAPLRNPKNDAEDLSTTLSGLGFKVTLKKNLDRRTLEDTIRLFGRQLKLGGVGLFYFAGHGMQVEGRNYLIPIDARIESESDVKYEAVDAGFVLGKMEDAQNLLNIVILDACRNNPYARYFRAASNGLARMDAPTGSLIVYSTAPGEVAADGPDRNGVFTKYLIKHMATPGLPVEQMLKRVRIDVASETKQRQIPWESSSLMGDFFFKPGSSKNMDASTPDREQPPAEQASILPSEAIRPNNLKTKKLAIFPMLVSENMPSYSSRGQNLQLLTLNTISEILLNDKRFNLIQSYYELKGDLRYQSIASEFLNTDGGGQIWAKKGFFSLKNEPRLDYVVKIANKIEADYVFMNNYYVVKDTHQTINADFYFINVKKNEMYFKDFECSMFSSYSEVTKFLKEFFASLKID